MTDAPKPRLTTKPPFLALRRHQRPRASMPWYLKNDLPSKELLDIRHQVRNLLDRNISTPAEIENLVALKQKQGASRRRTRRRRSHEAVFISKTRQYEKLFAGEGVQIKHEEAPAVRSPKLEAVAAAVKQHSRLEVLYNQSKRQVRSFDTHDRSFRSMRASPTRRTHSRATARV